MNLSDEFFEKIFLPFINEMVFYFLIKINFKIQKNNIEENYEIKNIIIPNSFESIIQIIIKSSSSIYLTGLCNFMNYLIMKSENLLILLKIILKIIEFIIEKENQYQTKSNIYR